MRTVREELGELHLRQLGHGSSSSVVALGVGLIVVGEGVGYCGGAASSWHICNVVDSCDQGAVVAAELYWLVKVSDLRC